MGVMASISGRVGDLGAYLREQRENAKLSVRQLASLAGVSNPYLSQVERGLRRPSAEVLQQIAKGLRISAEALYVRAGILEEGVRGTLEAAIDAEEGLTPRQKKVLRELCAHFRSENARAEEATERAAQQAAAVADAAGAAASDTEGVAAELESAFETAGEVDTDLDHGLGPNAAAESPATTTTDTAPPAR